jgi:hypothetical protein
VVDSGFSTVGGWFSVVGGRFWLLGTNFGRGWVVVLDHWVWFVCGYACGWDLILWVGEPIWVLGFRGGCAVSGFWVVMVLKVFRRG